MAEAGTTEKQVAVKSHRQVLEGVVVSDKMTKTVVVRVERLVKDPLYGRYRRRSVKFMAHDEENKCQLGDRVLIAEARPHSRRKRWSVRTVISKATGV